VLVTGAPRIYRSLDEAPDDFGPCALSVGNFDGVHLGHRRIFQRVAALACERGWRAAALTFHPHPARVVAPARAPRLLSTPEERAALMAAEGIEEVLILPFTEALARLSPEEFVRDVLAARLRARAVLVGENFRFGYRQSGDAAGLRALGARYGIEAEVVPPVRLRGWATSSSEVRRAIEAGAVARAGRLLERPYALAGEVVAGFGIGSRQTVPTLNLKTAAEVLPASGVYITRTEDAEDGRRWPSITNVGFRPTFHGEHLTIETYLLEPLEGATPRRIRVEFLRRVREERAFASPEALKAQILGDVARARAYFRRAARWVGRRRQDRPAPAAGR
jgi:riboflavin kinase/FMN adenylyltransferase